MRNYLLLTTLTLYVLLDVEPLKSLSMFDYLQKCKVVLLGLHYICFRRGVEVACNISSFICLFAGAVEWQPYYFGTLLLYMHLQKNDLDSRAICYLSRFSFTIFLISPAASVTFPTMFISLLALIFFILFNNFRKHCTIKMNVLYFINAPSIISKESSVILISKTNPDNNL